MSILKSGLYYCTMGVIIVAIAAVVALKFIPNYTINNGSMRPTIPVGAQIIVQPQQEYVINDVITFTSGGVTTTHRIIGFEPDGSFITKGDYNDDRDYLALPLTERDVIGKVVMIIPGFGTTLHLIVSMKWWLIGLVIVISATLYSLRRKPEDASEQISQPA